MKTIGFVDYYVSEWHANNYPAWIASLCEEMNMEFRVDYAWAERDTSPVTGETTDEWCARMGVTRCATLEELCEKSDVILVLAPTDPDRHLPYAKTVLRYGKPTYIDKTFAPSREEAREIFAIAEKYNTPLFSTSALRYATELQDAPEIASLTVTGSGSRFDEYLIHLVEQAVILLRDPVLSAHVTRQGEQRVCYLTTEHGKRATLVYAAKLPYAISAETADGKAWGKRVSSDFFRGLLADILRFYKTGKVPVTPAETLEVMRMRDMLLAADPIKE